MVNLEFPNRAPGASQRSVRHRTLLRLTAAMQAHIIDLASAFSAPAQRSGLFFANANEKDVAKRQQVLHTLQPVGKIRDGLAIDDRAIPFAHDLKIGSALSERRASVPAVGLQKIGGRGQHIRHAVA